MNPATDGLDLLVDLRDAVRRVRFVQAAAPRSGLLIGEWGVVRRVLAAIFRSAGQW